MTESAGRTRFVTAALVLVMALGAGAQARAAEPPLTEGYKPSFVPPADLAVMLGVHESGEHTVISWTQGGIEHQVEVRYNDPANLVFFTGPADDVAAAAALARQFDVAPRQIALEARIVEVDTDRAHDLGIDWSQVNLSAGLNQSLARRVTDQFQRVPGGSDRSYTRQTAGQVGNTSSLTLNNALTLLQQEGAATYRDTPRVLTLNNREATIFDGMHVTYVSKANAYTNMYTSEAMDAGLRLEVTPALGESGYLRLTLHAELTALVNVNSTSYLVTTRDYASIAGAPVKQGQVVDNVIMAKDGETILLGGFTRTEERHERRRVPVLGTLLPFLFSRDISERRHKEMLIAITPHVVDLAQGADERSKRLLEVR